MKPKAKSRNRDKAEPQNLEGTLRPAAVDAGQEEEVQHQSGGLRRLGAGGLVDSAALALPSGKIYKVP